MPRVFRAVVFILATAWVSSFGRADAIELSLEAALLRAESQSPFVRRARLERKVTAATRVDASVLLPDNPGLAVALGARHDSSGSLPPADGFEAVVHLEQRIEVAGQRKARLREAELNVRVADVRARLAVVETRARTRLAYVGTQIAEARAAQTLEREALAKRLLDSARARVHAGAAGDVELHLAEVEFGRMRAQRIEAELEVADVATTLRRLLALPLDDALKLTTPLSQPAPPTQPLAALLTAAQTHRAELQALDVSHSALDAELRRLTREIVPSPILFIDWAHQQPGQTYIGSGIAFTLPVWRRKQGERAQVRAKRELVEGEHELVEREVALEVERAYRIALVRAAEAERWEAEVVPAAERNVDLVTEGWRAGKFDLFRVIQVTREAAEIRHRQLELLGVLWQSAIELDRATGAQ